LKKSTQIISSTLEAEDAEAASELVADCETRACMVSAELHGLRIDRALVQVVPEFSRSYLQQLLENGDVLLNGEPCRKPAHRVRAGDDLHVSLRPTPQSRAFVAEQMALDVVYEDPLIWVINKPAGLVVHPAPGNWQGTLMNGLLGLDARQFDLPRAGIVHRLDKDTSGLMVVARTRSAMDYLVNAIATRSVKRQYLALVHGCWPHTSTLRLDQAIGRDPGNRLRMAVVDLSYQSGKPAMTDVDVLSRSVHGSALRCTLHTGRTHQIRVHLAHQGFPLLADTLYGGQAVGAMARQALHARRLEFLHPDGVRQLRFVAPIPHDMQVAMTQWALQYNADVF
jgi:23S rRNA pseudouridine1911/1915/1917 synthase